MYQYQWHSYHNVPVVTLVSYSRDHYTTYGLLALGYLWSCLKPVWVSSIPHSWISSCGNDTICSPNKHALINSLYAEYITLLFWYSWLAIYQSEIEIKLFMRFVTCIAQSAAVIKSLFPFDECCISGIFSE